MTRCSPEPDAIQAPLNNLITLHITDGGKGVDGDSVVIRVDGNIVYQGNVNTCETAYGRCSRSGTRNNYRFIYQGDALLPFDHLAVVTVDAADVAGNVMTTYSHVFTTEMRAFGNNLIVSNGNGDKSHPATVGDSAGNLRAAWAAGAEGSRNIYAATMTAAASSFGTPAQLTISKGDQCHPDIAVDGDGRLYVVWQDNRNGNWDIFLSTSSDGTTWSSPVQVTDSEYNEINPAIVVVSGSPDRAYVTWQDDRAGQEDIYVASSTNDFADSTVTQVTSNGDDQLDPDIAVDGTDTVYLIWTDMRNGQADLYGRFVRWWRLDQCPRS